MLSHLEPIRFARSTILEGLAQGAPRCFAALSMTTPNVGYFARQMDTRRRDASLRSA